MYNFQVPIERSNDKFAKNQPILLLSVIVPAFNEIQFVEESLTRLHQVLVEMNVKFQILVVESNSTDGTREKIFQLAEILNLKIVLQDAPRGKGFAVREGIREAEGDVLMIYDADNEYDPADIPRLITPIALGETSFVLGSRHRKGVSMRQNNSFSFIFFLMNLAHVFFTFLINSFFRVKLRDPFTMYKIFRREIFQNVKLISNRFDLDWELVGLAIRRGAVPLELPVSYKSRSFDEGKKIRVIRDPVTWLIALIRFRFFPIKIC
jgi:glycosyltransferase involved in cell wall biosynthesis